MPLYDWQPNSCKAKLEFYLWNTSNGDFSETFPEFFTYNADTKTVTLKGNKELFDERNKEFHF